MAVRTVQIDISTASPKQCEFFMARERFIAYGGARGGGKSWALRKKLSLLCTKYAGITALLLRRTYADLYNNHIKVLMVELSGIAVYSEKHKCFNFLNGSTLICGYLDSDRDLLQYQGQAYDIIAFDEATQFPEEHFDTLKACLRGNNPFPKRMYLTCNPGGIGHVWVKRLFIDRKFRDNEKPEEHKFIPATVFDNKVLLKSDPGYVDMLNSLSDKIRAAWRDGNWDMLAGQYFTEFDRNVHVTVPFVIPEHWKKYRTIDYGLDCLACLWIAIDERGDYYVYREYAESDKVISDGASDILRLTSGEKIDYTTAPDDLWQRSQETAKHKAEIFAENGLTLYKASRTREAGWLAVKELLKVYGEGEDGSTRLHIFNTCGLLIEHLPALQRDAKRPSDCMTEPHHITHLPDALRYFCLQYTSPSKVYDGRSDEQKWLDKMKRDAIRQAARNSRRY